VAASKREKLLWWVFAGAAVFYLFARSDKGAAFVTDVLTSGARGIRNNNPGNIRKSSTRWAGSVADVLQTDPAFVIFSAPEYGIRAMSKILKSYATRGLVTVEQIISTWAPANENNTAAYVAAVCRDLSLSPSTRLTTTDFPRLIAAIIKHENGTQPYPPEVIRQGVLLS